MQQKESNHFIYYHWLILGLLLTIVIVGCTISQPDVPRNESMLSDTNPTTTETVTAISPSATPTPTFNVTLSPSATPTTIDMATPSPSNTPTVTFTPVQTLMPLPTIPSQQRGQVYTDLMNSNGGCALPCWWGIELGVTPIEYIEQLYTSLDASITTRDFENGRFRITALFVDPQIENGEQVRHMFRAQDGIFIEAEIQLKSHPEYQIDPILERLGQPSEVWVWTIPEPREGILPADFLLYFPKQGVLVGYRTGAVKVEDAVNVCFDERGGATILLWDPAVWNPNGDKGFIERASESSELTLEGYRPLDEVSNWDVEQFYTVLTDLTHSECLETPSELWSAP